MRSTSSTSVAFGMPFSIKQEYLQCGSAESDWEPGERQALEDKFVEETLDLRLKMHFHREAAIPKP